MSWTPDETLPPTDAGVLADYIAALSATHEQAAQELEALESIYPASLRLLPAQGRSRAPSPSDEYVPAPPAAGERIRYQLTIPAWEGEDEVPSITVLVSLPATYPEDAPQLMLCGRYVGNFAIDAGLFGDITRTFITSTGVPFTPGEVCVFDGLVHVQSRVGAWHAERVAEGAAASAAREAERHEASEAEAPSIAQLSLSTPVPAKAKAPAAPSRPLPAITSSAPITDRKSAFVGHAAKITDESDVAAVVAHLLLDKKIARAAHPTIWAYRAVREVGGAAGRVVESDYDDDGETQAGARLKHLLEILELDNVLVVVTRWFGGIHLGPDRFKHINQAARDALEDAGLLGDTTAVRKKGRR